MTDRSIKLVLSLAGEPGSIEVVIDVHGDPKRLPTIGVINGTSKTLNRIVHLQGWWKEGDDVSIKETDSKQGE